MADMTNAQASPKEVRRLTPGYAKLKAAAAYLGVSVRYFRYHVGVRPKELPGSGRRPLLVWSIAELDAWVEHVTDPKSRLRKAPPRTG